MAYQTGASADIVTLLNALKNFAVANGWTELANDSYTLKFPIYPSSGSAKHNDTQSMVSSLDSSPAYDNQGEANVTATRVALGKNGVTWQLFAFHKKLYKNGVSGTYACMEAWVCDGWNAGVDAHLQTNNRKFALIGPLATSLYAYHLFSNGDFVHLVVEEMPGRFRHLSFGFIHKYGAFPGGQYLTSGCPIESSTTTPTNFNVSTALMPFGMNGQNPSKADLKAYGYGGSYVRADIDAMSVGWRLLTTRKYSSDGDNDVRGCGTYDNATNSRGGPSGVQSLNSLAHDLAYHCSPQSWNGLAPMLPCYVGAFRSPYNGNWTLLGEFPDVRFLNISNFNPGDEITLGTDVWKIFPLFNKAYTPQSEPISYDYGLAYRKVV